MSKRTFIDARVLALVPDLTDLERSFLTAFINGLYAEQHFSDMDVADVAAAMEVSKPTAKGVLGSLCKKGFVSTDDNGAGFDIIYLNEDYFFLHTAWREDELPPEYRETEPDVNAIHEAQIIEAETAASAPCVSCGLIEGCHVIYCPNDPDQDPEDNPNAGTMHVQAINDARREKDAAAPSTGKTREHRLHQLVNRKENAFTAVLDALPEDVRSPVTLRRIADTLIHNEAAAAEFDRYLRTCKAIDGIDAEFCPTCERSDSMRTDGKASWCAACGSDPSGAAAKINAEILEGLRS